MSVTKQVVLIMACISIGFGVGYDHSEPFIIGVALVLGMTVT